MTTTPNVPLTDFTLDPVALGRLHALDPDGSNGIVVRVLKAYDGTLERLLGLCHTTGHRIEYHRLLIELGLLLYIGDSQTLLQHQ